MHLRIHNNIYSFFRIYRDTGRLSSCMVIVFELFFIFDHVFLSSVFFSVANMFDYSSIFGNWKVIISSMISSFSQRDISRNVRKLHIIFKCAGVFQWSFDLLCFGIPTKNFTNKEKRFEKEN